MPRRARHPRPTGRPGWRTQLRRSAGMDGTPLRRPVDRTRTRLGAAVLLLALLAIAVSAVTGAALYRSDRHAADQQSAHLHRVTATTLAAAPADTAWAAGLPSQQVSARWQYPSGQVRTGQVQVPTGTGQGSAVAVWVDDSGLVSAPPRSTADVVTGAALTGLAVLTGSALACGTLRAVGRRRIDARTAAAWEQEWEQVEPRWSGRSRSA